MRTWSLSVFIGSLLLVVGCNRSTTRVAAPEKADSEDLQVVRLHFEGFTKSKSGAT